jgi:cobalamin biosynthesis Mg chelatase CobN
MPDDTSPTTDRLRKDIDRGRAGDKIGFPDPSAAPLGTDAEAGGTAPGPGARRTAHEQEVGREDGPTAAVGPRPVSMEPRRAGGSGRWIAIAVVLLVAVLMLVGGVWLVQTA